jgi:hypothetical protein
MIPDGVVLPAPLGPMNPKISPGPDLEAHVAQHVQGSVAVPEVASRGMVARDTVSRGWAAFTGPTSEPPPPHQRRPGTRREPGDR